jgi:hypothetical protein
MNITGVEIIQIVQLIATFAAGGGVLFHGIKLGRAVGRMEQLIEIHSKAIDRLSKIKQDKEVCEAYRNDHN